MKKCLLGILFLTSCLFASEIDDSLKAMGEGGGMLAGSAGLGVPHLIFWAPILVFFVLGGGIVFFYYSKFQQKDDGIAKVVLAFCVAMVVGVLGYTYSLRLADGAFNSEGCGKAVSVAYLKDAVQKGLNPTGYVFGQKIREVSCLNN